MMLFIKIVAGIIILVVLVVGGFVLFLTRGLNSGKALAVGRVKASEVKDGVYEGKYDGGRWSNTVNVTIENGRIAKIDIIKGVQFENAATTKELLGKVIEKQNTDVDTVTGATVTCKAYLKSVENALSK